MGQTIHNLASKPVANKTIFNNRFVIEICEAVHIHYRNLRILMSLDDWKSFVKGCSDSMLRWKSMGEPIPGSNQHIELCRKNIAKDENTDSFIKINLNKNLYLEHDGMIFSEGSEFEEDKYIHLKIRDLRIEMSVDEFNKLADCVLEAKERLCQSV